MLLTILAIFFSFKVSAIQLSPESLFRHASNGVVESNTVSINFLVKKLSDETGQPFYLRQIYGLEGDKLRMTQILFDGADMSNNQVQNVFTTANFMDYAGKNPEKDSLNMAVVNILYNSSWPMIAFLKKIGVPLKQNAESYNKDKIKLLESYRAYLKSPSGKENPLKPTIPEEKKKVSELNDSSLIVVSPETVKIIRKNKTNFIQITYPNFHALFTNQEHRLSELEITGKFHSHLVLEDYVTLNGLNYFPKFITVSVDSEIYKLQTLSYKYGNENYADFEKRAQSLQVLAKKNHKEVLIQKPTFLQ
ncbi:MAG: hypothetical protein ACOYL6_04120 [Bacteriovoracaceae bacterium]